MYTEFIYFMSLLTCILLGNHYRKIDNHQLKRNYGTGLGFMILFLTCGRKIYHSVFITWGNIIIIRCCDKRYLHQMSIAYTWLYLTYMYCNLEENEYFIYCMHQAMALRLVGLAFEINSAYRLKADDVKPASGKTSEKNDIPDQNNVVDIIAYAYCFVGLHKGPYYRWKTFYDHINTPYASLIDSRPITRQTIKKACLCAAGYIFLQTNFPSMKYYEDSFYSRSGADMRYLYNIPQLLSYVMQYQIIMFLCTAVFTEAGFGVYPNKCKAAPGQGPTAKPSLLALTTKERDVALEQEYDFAMLKSFRNEKLLFGPRMRDTLRSWDMSTQYWFWSNMHKLILKMNVQTRSIVAFVSWSLWCGVSMQQMIICFTLWLHIFFEKECSEMYLYTESMKTSWDIGFSIMRALCLIYLTPCFVIRERDVVLRYYNSMFWAYHVVLIGAVLFAVGFKSLLQVHLTSHTAKRVVVNPLPITLMTEPGIPDPAAGPSMTKTQVEV